MRPPSAQCRSSDIFVRSFLGKRQFPISISSRRAPLNFMPTGNAKAAHNGSTEICFAQNCHAGSPLCQHADTARLWRERRRPASFPSGIDCDYGGSLGEPYCFANRPGVCRCRHYSLAAGTVMGGTHRYWWDSGPPIWSPPDARHVGHTRGRGRGVHDMVPVAGAVEVKQRKHGGSLNKRRTGRCTGRVWLALVPDRSTISSSDLDIKRC